MTITARAGRIVLACLAVVATGIAAYAEMFSQFQYYDDEGDIMASVKSILDGRPLYDETYAHYGPFYFVLMRGADWALNYARIAAMAASACCLTMARADVRNRLNASPLRIFFVSVTVTAVVILSLVLLSGTSVEGLVASVIVRPIRFPTVFSVPWRLPEYGVLMGEVSVGAAVFLFWALRRERGWAWC